MPLRLALLDDDLALAALVVLEGLDQGLELALVEGVEDEVVGECVQQELNVLDPDGHGPLPRARSASFASSVRSSLVRSSLSASPKLAGK